MFSTLLLGGRFCSEENRQIDIILQLHFAVKNKQIANEIGRGVTLLQGKGWYTKEDASVLMVVVKRYESTNVFRAIKEIDPNAFISMGSVMGVYGQGFDPIKY